MIRLYHVLFALLLIVMPVQTVFALQPYRISALDITCFDLDGSYVYSQESTSIYLGFFGNQFAAESIMNELGKHGSAIGSLSVRNPIGNYGSPIATYSANNNITSTPPGIFKNGALIAYLTTNSLINGGISLATIDESCTFFATSPAIDDLPPVSPTAVSASDGLYTDAIEVSWAPVSGATSYTIFRAESVESTPQPITTVSSG